MARAILLTEKNALGPYHKYVVKLILTETESCAKQRIPPAHDISGPAKWKQEFKHKQFRVHPPWILLSLAPIPYMPHTHIHAYKQKNYLEPHTVPLLSPPTHMHCPTLYPSLQVWQQFERAPPFVPAFHDSLVKQQLCKSGNAPRMYRFFVCFELVHQGTFKLRPNVCNRLLRAAGWVPLDARGRLQH